MKIIACLGNPGKKYRKNRHNIGFLLGESIVHLAGLSPGKRDFSATTSSGIIAGDPVLFLFPETFMNNSGLSVRAALDYFRQTAANLIVIHDEIELPFGEVRTKFGGGHKGHNGLRSIIQHTGTADFHRIRLGVGRPPHPDMAVADYVLSDFTPDELEALARLVPIVFDSLSTLIEAGGPKG